MKKIVLVGTDHQLQYSDCRTFERIVRELIELNCAQVVLEEGDPVGEGRCSALTTVGHRVAEEKSLLRQNIAPAAKGEFSTTDCVRIAGMDIHTYGPVVNQINRENYMLGELERAMEKHNAALFICGLAHLGSMAEKLVGMGFQVEAYEWQLPR